MPEYAYHGTRKRDLSEIARRGLIPKMQPKHHKSEPRKISRAAIFFAPEEEMARQWGEVVVRFPWPSEYHHDWYGDSYISKKGEYLRTSNVMYDAVPPEYLQVKILGKWVPLLESRT